MIRLPIRRNYNDCVPNELAPHYPHALVPLEIARWTSWWPKRAAQETIAATVAAAAVAAAAPGAPAAAAVIAAAIETATGVTTVGTEVATTETGTVVGGETQGTETAGDVATPGTAVGTSEVEDTATVIRIETAGIGMGGAGGADAAEGTEVAETLDGERNLHHSPHSGVGLQQCIGVA